MKRKSMALLLAGAMTVTMLAGCGSVTEDQNQSLSTQTNNIVENSEEDTSSAVETKEDGTTVSEGSIDSDNKTAEKMTSESRLVNEDGSITEIEMYGLGFFGDDGLDEVMEQINAISEAEIGVHVNYHILDIASYLQQIPLMLVGGSEQVDLIMDTAIPNTSFGTFTAQNQLMDISEYMDDYAPETKELLARYLPATTVNGALYAIPCYRTYNSDYYLLMRKDILDQLGLTEEARNLSSWSAVKSLLQKVHDSQDQLPEEMRTTAMICNADSQGTVIGGMYIDTGADSFSDNYGFETLGDANRIIKVNDDGVVENYFADDDYRAMIERVTDWYDSGLVYKDAATSQDAWSQLIANNVSFSIIQQSEIGAEKGAKNQTGYDMIAVPYVSIPVQSSNVNTWAWSVPTGSEEPEAAIAFLNLMYTNPTIENLFVYGIEGRDYEVNEEGEAVLLDTKVYQNSEFFFGNQFNAYPTEGNGGDFRQVALESLDNAKLSPYFGCVIDTDPVANEQTSLKAVLNKYEASLESGTADTGTLDAMNAELGNAGLQKFLEYYQDQLDAWVAANK